MCWNAIVCKGYADSTPLVNVLVINTGKAGWSTHLILKFNYENFSIYFFWNYRGFHEKGTFSVHSFNDDYLSIPERPGSYKYLFHEIPVTRIVIKPFTAFYSFNLKFIFYLFFIDTFSDTGIFHLNYKKYILYFIFSFEVWQTVMATCQIGQSGNDKQYLCRNVYANKSFWYII